jgi:glycosyltransferase involved in cell wall biosynthesis
VQTASASVTPGTSEWSIQGPLFSVIIPTYNRAHVILHAVQSVLAQTCPDFELIIVDDGSTDSTPNLVGSLSDSRVCYLRQRNRGRTFARNIGASLAQGSYLVFLDSDDEVLPTWLARLESAIVPHRTGVISCGAYVQSPPGDQQATIVLPKPMGNWYRNVRALFTAGTFAIRRDVFFNAGGYAIGMEQSENTELGRRVVEYSNAHGLQAAVVNEPLVRYHRRREFRPDDKQLFRHLEESNKYMLRRHEAALRSAPHRYAYSCAIVGINAARLGCAGEARRWLWLAAKSDPWNWKNYLRYMIMLIPGLGRTIWLRSDRLRG